MQILIDGRTYATYVYDDKEIRRPYFMHVHAPGGVQVTRNQPPIKGTDIDDHPTFHPGVWLAFGDLAGSDFWRNRGQVSHVGFEKQPQGGASRGSFAVRNRYEDGKCVICEEVCQITVLVRPSGYLLIYDSTFSSADQDFYFGDQEEMGLGIRVATPLAVKQGGRIVNCDGLINEAQVWGQQADWCRYEGRIDGRSVGIAILSDSKNFRRPWFHARDYGLLVANPFGRRAFTKGEPSRLVVKQGEPFHLRFGVLTYGDDSVDLAAVYRDFLMEKE